MKSVILESSNDIHLQNNTLEYDHRLCWTFLIELTN